LEKNREGNGNFAAQGCEISIKINYMTLPPEITTLMFDWGDTLMSMDEPYEGPMVTWPVVRTVPGAVEALAALHGRFRLVVGTMPPNRPPRRSAAR
jgi:hypothetical protein